MPIDNNGSREYDHPWTYTDGNGNTQYRFKIVGYGIYGPVIQETKPTDIDDHEKRAWSCTEWYSAIAENLIYIPSKDFDAVDASEEPPKEVEEKSTQARYNGDRQDNGNFYILKKQVREAKENNRDFIFVVVQTVGPQQWEVVDHTEQIDAEDLDDEVDLLGRADVRKGQKDREPAIEITWTVIPDLADKPEPHEYADPSVITHFHPIEPEHDPRLTDNPELPYSIDELGFEPCNIKPLAAHRRRDYTKARWTTLDELIG